MFALVEIAGIQFEVKPEDIVTAPLMAGEPGDVVVFDKILLTKNDDTTVVGSPYIEGKVSAKIIEHKKDKTVIVFKKKRRKGYRKLNGHRQSYTIIEITDINIQ